MTRAPLIRSISRSLTLLLIVVGLALLAPCRPVLAQSCNLIGVFINCDNGVSGQRIGNSTYWNGGSSSQRVGNSTYNSDGSSSQRIGNSTYYSDGTSSQRIGNSTYFSDGRICQRLGNQVICD
jgi:hypothetical protein